MSVVKRKVLFKISIILSLFLYASSSILVVTHASIQFWFVIFVINCTSCYKCWNLAYSSSRSRTIAGNLRLIYFGVGKLTNNIVFLKLGSISDTNDVHSYESDRLSQQKPTADPQKNTRPGEPFRSHISPLWVMPFFVHDYRKRWEAVIIFWMALSKQH